ncbi:hypothetical protein IFR05_001182 [Cadophora sp. M221]|nr:hypothetical protein IFR05_001182 [Cadophora sp. M221]
MSAPVAEDTYDGESILEINLTDDPNEQGQTRLPLGSSRFASETSGFSLTIRELYAVHGTGIWDSKAGEFASLLILRVKAFDRDTSRGRRIKNVEARLRFKSEAASPLPKDDPYIVCFAPAQEHKIGLLPTSVLRTKHASHAISLDVDANPAPINAGFQLGGDNSWEWKKDIWATLAGEAYQSPVGRGRLGDNVVHWTISENDKAHQIMDTVDVGILLRRPNDSKFTISFSQVKVTVDMRYAINAGVQEAIDGAIDMARSLVGYESVPTNLHTYDPTKQGKRPAGVVDGNLHLLEEGTELEKFAFMHILERVRGIRYDDPGESNQAEDNAGE